MDLGIRFVITGVVARIELVPEEIRRVVRDARKLGGGGGVVGLNIGEVPVAEHALGELACRRGSLGAEVA